MGDTPALFSTEILVSSPLKSATRRGFAGRTETPVLEDTHVCHLNQMGLYFNTVDEAFDSNCSCRRPGTMLVMGQGSFKEAASGQTPDCSTVSEKQKEMNVETPKENKCELSSN